jgi:hypothetical protein
MITAVLLNAKLPLVFDSLLQLVINHVYYAEISFFRNDKIIPQLNH